MEQNREMLAERGERLRQLNDRSEVLQGDAEDFASNAKRLAVMYTNRKWWQLCGGGVVPALDTTRPLSHNPPPPPHTHTQASPL